MLFLNVEVVMGRTPNSADNLQFRNEHLNHFRCRNIVYHCAAQKSTCHTSAAAIRFRRD